MKNNRTVGTNKTYIHTEDVVNFLDFFSCILPCLDDNEVHNYNKFLSINVSSYCLFHNEVVA